MTVLSTNPPRSRLIDEIDREARSRTAAIAAASVFAIAGLVIVAIGAAFPLALAVVETRDLQVPAADLALAQRIEPFWPAIVAVGVANLVAAFAALDRGALGKRIALVVAGSSAAVAMAAQVALTLSGESAIVATVVGSAYLVALVAMVVVERRQAS
jgi:hypothetical protein